MRDEKLEKIGVSIFPALLLAIALHAGIAAAQT